jgi:hypothetical protein
MKMKMKMINCDKGDLDLNEIDIIQINAYALYVRYVNDE